MKISLSIIHILTYVLAITTTLSKPVYVPPVSNSDSYVDGAQLINNHETDVQVRTGGTTLALEERQFEPVKAIIAISIYAAIVSYPL
jgi:hypothetical protein